MSKKMERYLKIKNVLFFALIVFSTAGVRASPVVDAREALKALTRIVGQIPDQKDREKLRYAEGQLEKIIESLDAVAPEPALCQRFVNALVSYDKIEARSDSMLQCHLNFNDCRILNESTDGEGHWHVTTAPQ